MEKNDLVYIGHMVDMAQGLVPRALKIPQRVRFGRGAGFGLAHLLQVIGEAARKVSEDFRHRRPGVPWRAIVGMRHRIVHDYMAVDFDVVWDVVTNDLSVLINELSKLMPKP
jgi:uncharacterized protein with HEPN domain